MDFQDSTGDADFFGCVDRLLLIQKFPKRRILSQIALIAGKILFIFSLKMKRLYRKAGIAIPENTSCFDSEKKSGLTSFKSILIELFKKLDFCNLDRK